MKKLIFAFAICLAFAACDNSKNRKVSNVSLIDSTLPKGTPRPIVADSTNPAIIKFEKEVYDFGTINAGDSVKFDFKFINTGKTPLIIISADGSCGCTIAEYPQTPLAPGKTGVIKAVYHSLGYDGKQDKIITVSANTIPRSKEVRLTGFVKGNKEIK